METIKFKLSGGGATFKRPYINNVNLTYSHIHKIAILGMFGAILGLEGHRHKEEDERFPEFYEKLKGLKISIVPCQDRIFQRDTKVFSETTGFFNKRETLIIKEQFLIYPEWDIYLMQGTVTEDLFTALKYALLHNESVFEPFLGKNHFPAVIEQVETIKIKTTNNIEVMDSLFPINDLESEEPLDSDDDYFCLKEFMPIRFTPYLNYYHEEEMCLTNYPIVSCSRVPIYTDGERNLYFM